MGLKVSERKISPVVWRKPLPLLVEGWPVMNSTCRISERVKTNKISSRPLFCPVVLGFRCWACHPHCHWYQHHHNHLVLPLSWITRHVLVAQLTIQVLASHLLHLFSGPWLLDTIQKHPWAHLSGHSGAYHGLYGSSLYSYDVDHFRDHVQGVPKKV